MMVSRLEVPSLYKSCGAETPVLLLRGEFILVNVDDLYSFSPDACEQIKGGLGLLK